jgi:aspartyl-tRNA(Asn)/glutamyl-tRNA(Gln) amidotransferase subunit C
MSFTRDQIDYVAKLARLNLTEQEKDLFTGQMDAILNYVTTMNELDTEGIVPTSHAVPVENAFRPDIITDSIGTEKALANAPDREGTYFRVPPVIE